MNGRRWAPIIAAGAALGVAFGAALTITAVPNDRLPEPVVTVTHTRYVPVVAPQRPAPTVTITATRTARPARAATRAPVAPVGGTEWAAGAWHRHPRAVAVGARCVAEHESINAGLWTAENPYSTASGFAQWVDGTWQAHAARAGVGTEYDRAADAPPPVQADVFAWGWVHNRTAWRGTGCPGTE